MTRNRPKRRRERQLAARGLRGGQRMTLTPGFGSIYGFTPRPADECVREPSERKQQEAEARAEHGRATAHEALLTGINRRKKKRKAAA